MNTSFMKGFYKMTKEELALEVIDRLKKEYPLADCTLDYDEAWKLLVSVRLAAQCTDARVNLVTPTLFQKYPTLQDFADADISELESVVKPCGFYRMKAKNIKEMAEQLLTKYHGVVPDTMEDLLALSGVGRKTANLILGDVYGKPAIVADTHFIRITGRLGLTNSKDPVQVERDLRPLVPPERSSDFCHRIVWFGRDTCRARKPQCNGCPMSDFCPSFPEN